MPSSYTSSTRLTKQGIGENKNTWGNILNTVIDLVDNTVAGRTTVSVTSGTNITLSVNNGADDEARSACLFLTGTPSANINVLIPAVSKKYVVELDISGSFTVTLKTNSGAGVTFSSNPVRSVHEVWCNGLDVFEISEPQKAIKMWSGSIASIPGGHVFCDGNNGTPDLRDRFIVAATQDDSGTAKTNITGSLLQTGGGSTSVTGASGDHNHGAATGSTTLTEAQIPSHRHQLIADELINEGATFNAVTANTQVPREASTSSSQAYRMARSSSDATLGRSSLTGGGQGHTHSIGSSGTHTHTLGAAVPAFYALAYIMRV